MSAPSVRGIDDVDMKLEVAVIPVSNVERAKEFYGRLGWRLDQTPPNLVQYTPHGSGCSVQFGDGLTSAEPGSAKEFLIVSDIVSARDALIASGINVDEISHMTTEGPARGIDPERRSYLSRASFNDPDGNTWLLQEVTSRLPGRIEEDETSYASASDLASSLRRAAAAYGEHQRRTGQGDANWMDWFAEHMVTERTGTTPPM